MITPFFVFFFPCVYDPFVGVTKSVSEIYESYHLLQRLRLEREEEPPPPPPPMKL